MPRYFILSTCSIGIPPQEKFIREVKEEILEKSVNLVFVYLIVNLFAFSQI